MTPDGLSLPRLPLPSLTCRPGYLWYVVATVCVGAFMAALDASIVNVALPTMKHAFGARYGTIEWVLIAYLLTLASLLPLLGRLADLYGRRMLYSVGFVVFVVGSVACGAAQGMAVLIGARVVQAVGAAMLQANSVAIITAAVPPDHRGRAIGFQGAAQAIGLSVGPAVGGALIGLFGWRAVFYVNVPVGLVGTALALLILPRDPRRDRPEAFDWTGSATLTVALVALMLVLSQGEAWGWTSAAILWFAGAAVLALLAFVSTERRVAAPIIDPVLVRTPAFSIGTTTGLLSYHTMFGVLFLMPFYLEHVLHLPPTVTGLLLTPIPLGMTVAAPLAGGLADRFGSRLLTVAGMAISALGVGTLILVIGVTPVPLPLLLAAFGVVGVGLGTFTPPNNSSVMGAAPRSHLGVAGGILNMARSLGMALGTAVSGLMLAAFLPAGAAGVARVPAIRDALIGVLVVACVTAALSALRHGEERSDEGRAAIEL